MKQKTAFLAVILSACSMLAACGDANVTESTVELKKDGKITEYSIEEFAESYYDPEELKSYIETAVDSYSDTHEGSVKIKKSEVEDGTAYLTMTYDSADTFCEFNRVSCFSGSVEAAQSAGYDFDTEFIQVTGEDDDADSSVIGSSVQPMIPFDAIPKEEGLKVFVIGEDVSVIVPGKIAYVSADHTNVTGANTVSVLVDEETADENSLIYVLYQ